MSVNKISAEITQEVETEILGDIATLAGKLPFLTSLQSEDRIKMAKLSRKYVDFVDRGLIYAKSQPQYAAPYMNLTEFEKDVKLKDSLRRILTELEPLCKRMEDTIMVAESEAYAAARVYYKSVKTAAKEGAMEAERIADDLSYHYKKKNTSNDNNDNGTNGSASNTNNGNNA